MGFHAVSIESAVALQKTELIAARSLEISKIASFRDSASNTQAKVLLWNDR